MRRVASHRHSASLAARANRSEGWDGSDGGLFFARFASALHQRKQLSPCPSASSVGPTCGNTTWGNLRWRPSHNRATWVSNVPQLLRARPWDLELACSLQLAPDSTLWISTLYSGEEPGHSRPPAGQNFGIPAADLGHHPAPQCAGCSAAGWPPGATSIGWASFRTWGHLPAVITNMLYAPAALNYEQGCATDSVQFWASSAGLCPLACVGTLATPAAALPTRPAAAK